MASSLALVLALGSAAYLASPEAVAAADLPDRLQHFHPLAADLNQLAESVRLCSAVPSSCWEDRQMHSSLTKEGSGRQNGPQASSRIFEHKKIYL